MSLSSFRDYMLCEKRYASCTILAYTADVSGFLEFCRQEFGFISMEEVTYKTIRSWVVFCVNSGLSGRSVNRKIVSLKSYFGYLLKSGLIRSNLFSGHVPLRISKKVQLPFSVKEVYECLNVDSFDKFTFEGVRDRAIMELLYATGVRRSELLGLRVGDVDFDIHTIRVVGKGLKERMIPVLKCCVAAIEDYVKEREKISVSTDLLFVSRKGSPMSVSSLYRMVRCNMEKVSTKAKVSPHVFRHSAATHLLSGGVDINYVKEMLGHSGLLATQVYVHGSLTDIKRQYKKAHPRVKS